MRLLHTLTLVALATFGTLALADPPARVGRIAVAQGDVSLRNGDGDEAGAALLNWPITSDSRISTARGATAEFRVGSTAVRLEPDSALDVEELDDDSFKLRLQYGSVSVRVKNADMLPGFELTTAQTRVLLQQPGQVRVETERQADTSVVSVVSGEARVDGGGASLVVRAGKRADVHTDDVSTGSLQRSSADQWPDTALAASPSLRYLGDDVTGYEELDRYGSWRDSAEYGALWLPRSVPADWAPYRDGSWTWLAPWGWTWIDNAPWGYAPSHYGNWVMVNQRWAWTPGPRRGRPVWAPALVGWVGGNNWQANFNVGGQRRPAPAVGWFPLSPRERFVPSYRVSTDYERRLNATRDGRGRAPNDGGRRDGLTVLPHERFGSRNTISVGNAPRGLMAPGEPGRAPLGAAPMPQRNPARVLETERPREQAGRSWSGRDGSAPQMQIGAPNSSGRTVYEGPRRDGRPGMQPGAPLATEQLRAEQTRAEQARVDQLRAEQARNEQSRNEQARNEQMRAERLRAEQNRNEQNRNEQNRAEQARAEAARGESRPGRQPRPEPDAGQRPQQQQPARIVVPPVSVQVPAVPRPARQPEAARPGQRSNSEIERDKRQTEAEELRSHNNR